LVTVHPAWLVILAGCGRIGFDAIGGPGGDDAPGGDGGGGGGDGDGDVARAPYRDAVLADAPRAYFRLDDTGTTAVDETNRFTGTYSGGCTRGLAGLLANDASTAVRFDGNTCRITITGDLGFNGRLPFSVELWARQDTTATPTSFFMNQIRQGGNPREGYALVDSTMGVLFERYGEMTSRYATPYLSKVGELTHYVGTYDGGVLRLYINGVEAGINTDAVQVVAQTGSIAVIGNYPSASGDMALDGVIDEVAIYDKVLSPERIAHHYSIGQLGP
jgi:hypothetical protein